MSDFRGLESIDSGSNYKFGEKMNMPNNPRSMFDNSHLVTTTIPNAGMVIPLDWMETLPGDDHDIVVECILRVMPQVVPLYSRQRLYIYAFWNRLGDLWNNFEVFMKKGYSGDVIKRIPILKRGVNFKSDASTIEADSFHNYMGLPVGATTDSLFGSALDADDNAGITALADMMALRVMRDYFIDKNEFISDRVLLPDDDSRFRLDDDGQLLSAKDRGDKFYFGGCKRPTVEHPEYYDFTIEEVTEGGETYNEYVFNGFFHNYPQDYFLSCLPFTQRGTAPTLDYTIDLSSLGIDMTEAMDNSGSGVSYSELKFKKIADGDYKFHVDTTNLTSENVLNAFSKIGISGENIGLKIYLESIRELAIAQTEMEKMAKTDGSYAEFGLTFFGEKSKNSIDFRPVYVGGTYRNITFTEVLQTAGSTIGTTDPEATSPLGALGGHGIVGIQNGNLGHLHCDDYGILMFFACIMPDIYYSQGIEKKFTRALQSEFLLPERTRLGMQPVLNKELFYAGDNGSDAGEDNYLFAYNDPFEEYRYQQNKITGKIADSSNKTFFPYTQSRKFANRPNWGREFSEAKNVRKDYLYSLSEDAYSAQFSFNIRSVREMPYRANPASIV